MIYYSMSEPSTAFSTTFVSYWLSMQTITRNYIREVDSYSLIRLSSAVESSLVMEFDMIRLSWKG